MHEPSMYEIRLQGHLAPAWAACFEGMAVAPQPDGTTILRGSLADQAALHGVLARIRDLGLELVRVERIEGAVASE